MQTGRRWVFVAMLVTVALTYLWTGPTAHARPPMGGTCVPQEFKPSSKWVGSIKLDPRAELIVPVNVVRVYSREHSAERIAPRKWLTTQLEITNRLFRYSDTAMGTYGPGRPAPCMQFRLRKVIDVHEDEVSDIIGFKVDTESILGGTRNNGGAKSGTWDLRSLKITDGTQYLTVFCVWAVKNPKDLGGPGWGGESNVGFADRPIAGRRRVLTRVTATRARMGVVLARAENAWMNTVAHEFGHYFGLYHAWEHRRNAQRNIRDLGTGPKRSVDGHPDWANVMDYDNGPKVYQYFAKSQMVYMYKFAKERASTQIAVLRTGGGTVVPPTTPPAARFKKIWVDPPTPGGKVVVHTTMEIDHLLKKTGNAVAWFADGSGQMLRDADGKFRSTNGQVSVGVKFTPSYEKSVYKDFKLTLPAGQLHLSPGRHKVSVYVGTFYAGKFLGSSKRATFEYVVSSRTPDPQPGGKPAAWFTEVTVDPAVQYKDGKSVKIKANLRIDHLIGKTLRVDARFYFPQGKALRDFDQKYRSAAGLVLASNTIVPKYKKTTVTGMTVRIPVSQLHLAAGSHKMYAYLTISDGDKVLASKSTPYFTAGSGAPPKPAAKRSVKFQTVWVTHNHTVGKEKGLRVHMRMTVSGCLRQKVQIAAWFWFANGNVLKDFNGRYNAKNQVAASSTVTPIYGVSTFSDATIFIPYSELHLRKGTYNLAVNVGAYFGGQRIGYLQRKTPFRVVWGN